MTLEHFWTMSLMLVLAGGVVLASLGIIWLVDFLFTLDAAATWVLELLE